ncbi:hypothetical protein LB504_001393 [Fusarium proliferatum]|nr:hypothetical protein LB504_001393 [Fusarium proliferatum]
MYGKCNEIKNFVQVMPSSTYIQSKIISTREERETMFNQTWVDTSTIVRSSLRSRNGLLWELYRQLRPLFRLGETNGGGVDEASITGRTREPLKTLVPASAANKYDVAIPQTTTEVTQSVESASSSNVSKDGSSNKAWIAGAVIPSVLVVALAVTFSIWWRKRQGRTPKTPKSPHLYDMAGEADFDKPELDSQGIPRPGSKEEPITSSSTAVHDTTISPVPAEMPENGLNRAELQGEVTGGTGQTHGSGAYYELPANGATVYELSTKLLRSREGASLFSF